VALALLEATMRMMKRMGLGVGATLVVLSVAGGGFAAAADQNTSTAQEPADRGRGRGGPGPFGRGGPGGPPPFGGLNLRALNLTEAQRGQVQGIMESHREETKAIGDRAFAARKALEDAVAADNFDEGTIRARAADLSTVETDMAVMRGRIHSEILQVLTPEQKAQAKQFRQEMQERMKKRMERAPRRGAFLGRMFDHWMM
jgi:Spy/CpxP family protein refolding chaperone